MHPNFWVARKAEGATLSVKAADSTERPVPYDMKQTDTGIQEDWGYNQRDASCFSSKSRNSNMRRDRADTPWDIAALFFTVLIAHSKWYKQVWAFPTRAPSKPLTYATPHFSQMEKSKCQTLGSLWTSTIHFVVGVYPRCPTPSRLSLRRKWGRGECLPWVTWSQSFSSTSYIRWCA